MKVATVLYEVVDKGIV